MLICEYTLVSFIDQQPRQNTAQTLQICSEAGNGEDGNQFGSLNYYPGEPPLHGILHLHLRI